MFKSALFNVLSVLGNYYFFQVTMVEAVLANGFQRIPQPHVLETIAFLKGFVFQILQLPRCAQVRVSQVVTVL